MSIKKTKKEESKVWKEKLSKTLPTPKDNKDKSKTSKE